MGHFLDLDAWPRRHLFDFFKTFAQPFFDICAPLDITTALRACKRQGMPFSLAVWHLVLEAANATEAFRYRLRGDAVWVHDSLSVGTTVAVEGDAFRFCYFDSAPELHTFIAQARATADALKSTPTGAPLITQDDRDDLIHGSMVPWIAFTSVSHAQSARMGSTPKIVLGKFTAQRQGEEERMLMPISVHVHHALMDAVHIAQFLDRLQTSLNAMDQ